MTMSKSYSELKAYHREQRDTWGLGVNVRVHRALSWFARAEQEIARQDSDAAFIFLWLSFNAAYANEYEGVTRAKARETYVAFFERIVGYDQQNEIYTILWQKYSSSVRSLLENKFVYQRFWDAVTGVPGASDWQDKFNSARRASQTALAAQDTVTVLSVVMERLYTLRNQLIHGGATWNGSWNRQQLRDAVALLSELMPVIIQLMMEHGNEVWGDASYYWGE
jgi:hypothetical protein